MLAPRPGAHEAGPFVAAPLRFVDNSATQRMFARLFRGRRQAQEFVRVDSRQGMEAANGDAAFGKSARLVDCQRMNLCQAFDGATAFDEDARAGEPREGGQLEKARELAGEPQSRFSTGHINWLPFSDKKWNQYLLDGLKLAGCSLD